MYVLQLANPAHPTARIDDHSTLTLEWGAWAWAVASLVSPSMRVPVRSLTDECVERRDAFPPREQLPLPTQPPYTAHIGNMAFETTSQEVSDFFKDCDVTNVRIVEDKIERKPKGFGYVEFATLEGLKTALSYAGSSLGGRSIRVSVADPRKSKSLSLTIDVSLTHV